MIYSQECKNEANKYSFFVCITVPRYNNFSFKISHRYPLQNLRKLRYLQISLIISIKIRVLHLLRFLWIFMHS